MRESNTTELFQSFLDHCAEWFEANGVSVINVKLSQLVSQSQFRNALIRQEFHDACPDKREAILFVLEKRYGLNRNTIDLITRSYR